VGAVEEPACHWNKTAQKQKSPMQRIVALLVKHYRPESFILVSDWRNWHRGRWSRPEVNA